MIKNVFSVTTLTLPMLSAYRVRAYRQGLRKGRRGEDKRKEREEGTGEWKRGEEEQWESGRAGLGKRGMEMRMRVSQLQLLDHPNRSQGMAYLT